jgi:cell division protein FtsB
MSKTWNGEHTVAEITTLYDNLLTENLKLRDDRIKLQKENSYLLGKIHSLETENSKLKEIN